MNRCYSLIVMLVLLSTILATGPLPASMTLAATRERPMLVRVDLHNASVLQKVSGRGFDIAFVHPRDHAEIVADDNDFNRLQAIGVNPQIIHQDLVAFYQSRNSLELTMGGFRTYSEALAFMDSLHTQYPSITTARDSIGPSYEGRALWMMKISDNPDVDEDEPEFFINGLIHAREPMGMEASLRFMQYLCENYGTDSLVTNLVNNREFFFVPMINPDGYEYNRQTNPDGGGMWRKNRDSLGVDLNRNWSYEWGYDDIGSSPFPDADDYRGGFPFSEPETEALREFIDARHFMIIMNFHTYGGQFLYPWSYIAQYTPDQPIFSVIGDSCTAANGYEDGCPWEIINFVNGDANDWGYGEQIEKPKIFGVAMEIGDTTDGMWPAPERIPILWNQCLPTLLFLSKIADNPYAIGVPPAPILNSIGDVYGDSFTVSWHSEDTPNPSVSYELKEMTGFQRLTDSLEVDASNWILDGFTWQTNRRHSGTHSLYSGSQNNYDATALLVNRVTIGPDDSLEFWTWYRNEYYFDYAYVQVSTDGGVTYENLAGNITSNDNPYYRNLGNGITGARNWTLAKFPLGAYAGQSVQLRMRYMTDGSLYQEGFYADDFYPVENYQQENTLSSSIPDTFYVVSGRAGGEYYYKVGGVDVQGQWSGSSNIERAIVHPACDYFRGDINGNGIANGVDIVYAVNYLKGAGNPPPVDCGGLCPEPSPFYAAGDVNGNCAFNGIDITFFVRYLKGQVPSLLYCPDCPPAR